jgi:hypothetical protein
MSIGSKNALRECLRTFCGRHLSGKSLILLLGDISEMDKHRTGYRREEDNSRTEIVPGINRASRPSSAEADPS